MKWCIAYKFFYILQVGHNIAEAQEDHYAQWKAKGVKSFQFAPGDHVLWRVMKNVGCKGG